MASRQVAWAYNADFRCFLQVGCAVTRVGKRGQSVFPFLNNSGPFPRLSRIILRIGILLRRRKKRYNRRSPKRLTESEAGQGARIPTINDTSEMGHSRGLPRSGNRPLPLASPPQISLSSTS